MSSSGLIYAVIVGAWAAYLVPMWLRRQDELNEARPTERFSTAIRLLSGRAAMERRVSRNLDGDADGDASGNGAAEPGGSPGPSAAERPGPGARPRPQAPVQVAPPTRERAADPDAARPAAPRPDPPRSDAPRPDVPRSDVPRSEPARPAARHTPPPSAPSGTAHGGTSPARRPEQQRRAALLARRRRMVILLFVVFTVGMITAAVGGVALLWVPAVPAVLFSVYIAHLRRQERRRFEVKIDRRRAAEAAQRLRDRERERRRAAAAPETEAAPVEAPRPGDFAHPVVHPTGRTATVTGVHHVQALVDAADTDEADDSDDADEGVPTPRPASRTAPRRPDPAHEAPAAGGSGEAESWNPVPVPLPTYVTAPVAPRSTGGLDLNAPDTWSSGRSTATPPPAPAKRPPATPLFDQYADDAQHPRAANE